MSSRCLSKGGSIFCVSRVRGFAQEAYKNVTGGNLSHVVAILV